MGFGAHMGDVPDGAVMFTNVQNERNCGVLIGRLLAIIGRQWVNLGRC
jgi:hypothetical protein